MSSGGVKIQAATDDRVQDIVNINNKFLGSKHACCCIPLSCQTAKTQRDLFSSCPDKMNVGGLAVDEESGEALGYCQLSFKGMPTELHTMKEGECYVEWLAVMPNARGKGVGTKLLKWAEETARSRNSSHMTLSVIRGNRALGLYKRDGFAITQEDCCEEICGCCLVTFLFGRPYGCFDCGWGALNMKKPLPARFQNPPALSHTHSQPGYQKSQPGYQQQQQPGYPPQQQGYPPATNPSYPPQQHPPLATAPPQQPGYQQPPKKHRVVDEVVDEVVEEVVDEALEELLS